jgi:aspartyl-tRNA(Asn)/glutamyl-tRNA(Gln) amidotransferase subunit C
MTNQSNHKINDKKFQQLLKMSYLKVDDNLLQKTSQTISNIVEWAEQLNSVNTVNVKPMFTLADLLNQTILALREDKVNDGNYVETLLKNAPDKVDVFFTVPKVIDEEK